VTTNSIVLIVVAILVALALAGMVAIFSRKFRTDRRLLGGATVVGEMAADAAVAQHRDDVRAQHQGRPVTED
jgi:ABC-type phosphate transport system permease subunit